jgi:ribosomal protein L18
MGLKVTNNAFGTLNAGITNSDTTVVLQSGQGSRFPSLSSGDYFYATLIDTSNNLEIVKVTARSTDTMTVERAQDNTTARAYSTNDRFELRPTAAMLNEVINKAESAATTGKAIAMAIVFGG